MDIINNQLTVLVTFYNQEKYVDQALNSIFMQHTEFPFKVIVGDDSSTDGTIEKIKAWKKKYPNKLSILVQERNPNEKYVKGARASKNRICLLKKVDTPYFIFLDGDDYFTDINKLQMQYDILENSNNHDCVACGHNIRMYNETNPCKDIFIPGKIFKEGKYSLKKYWDTTYFHTNTILFRSDHIKDIRFDILEDSFNDNLITYSFLQFGKIFFIKDCMADYRQNEQGIWAGEKKSISIFREFLAYDLEIKINSKIEKISKRRHYSIFKAFAKDHELFKDVGVEYLKLAKKYGCHTAVRALESKHLFTNDWSTDNRILNRIFFEICLKYLFHPLLALNRIWKEIKR